MTHAHLRGRGMDRHQATAPVATTKENALTSTSPENKNGESKGNVIVFNAAGPINPLDPAVFARAAGRRSTIQHCVHGFPTELASAGLPRITGSDVVIVGPVRHGKTSCALAILTDALKGRATTWIRDHGEGA
jgi:hypothetical protein